MRAIRLWLVAGLFFPAAERAAAQPERYEVGRRMKAFEEAWEKYPDPKSRKRALEILPKATTQFLTTQFGEAGRTLDLARAALVSEVVPSPGRQWVHSLSVIPHVRLVDGAATEIAVTIKPLYSVVGPMPKDLELRFWFVNDPVIAIKPEKFPITVKVPLPPLGEFPGLDRRLYASIEGAKEAIVRTCLVSHVKNVQGRLTALKSASDAWPALDTIEKATVRDRLELLSSLTAGTTPETDYPAADLLSNAEKMLDGKPLFAPEKPGLFWLSLPLGSMKTAPVRVFVPKGLDAAKPVPVVVALHGAGGSENLFFEGYGAGRIVTECRSRGWILVAPRSGLSFLSSPSVPEIVAELARRYPIDRKRVFLLGHSMGAAQTVDLVQKHPGTFAAAAALGGGGRVKQPAAIKEMPFFIGVGTKDFALSAARGLHKALAEGDVKHATLTEYPDLDHLLVVREALPDVFALFEKAIK